MSTVEPLWSVDLRPFGGHAIGPDGRGGWLASTGRSLVSFMPDDRRRWEVEYLGDVKTPWRLCTHDSIITIEGDQVVTRDLDTGVVAAAFPAPEAFWYFLDPWGGLLFSDSVSGSGGVLRRTAMTGEFSWSIPMVNPSSAFPTVFDDLLLLHVGGLLRAFDRDGQVRWAVGHDGFHAPDMAVPPDDLVDECYTSPYRVGPGRLLVGFEWHSGGGLFIVDPVEGSVQRFAAGSGRATLEPVEVITAAGGDFRVATYGGQREVSRLQYEYSVLMFDAHGNDLWEHWLPEPVASLVEGVDGALIVSASPTQKRWDDYHKHADLSDTTYVRCIGPDGVERWRWYAPGPQFPSLSPDGEIYLVSDGRLWALPAS